MGKFRKTVQRRFYDILDNTVFTSDDFDIVFGDTNKDESIISITFIHDENFEFEIEKNIPKT